MISLTSPADLCLISLLSSLPDDQSWASSWTEVTFWMLFLSVSLQCKCRHWWQKPFTESRHCCSPTNDLQITASMVVWSDGTCAVLDPLGNASQAKLSQFQLCWGHKWAVVRASEGLCGSCCEDKGKLCPPGLRGTTVQAV